MAFLQTDFSDGIPKELGWKIGPTPEKVKVEPSSLKIDPNYQTDFWRNTYYDPVLQAYNGHVLGLDTQEEYFVAETRFTFKPSANTRRGIRLGKANSVIGHHFTTLAYQQFEQQPVVTVKYDQAGIFVGVDQATWIKAGVEFVDGEAWQSVVVTRNDYSDWSKAKQSWPKDTDVCMKLYRQGQSFVVEVSDDSGKTYDFVRIAHLPVKGQVTVGMMICRPPSKEDAGSTCGADYCGDFKYFNLLKNSGYHHHA